MWRALPLLLIGAAAGAAVTYAWVGMRGQPSAGHGISEARGPADAEVAERLSIAEQLELYEQAQTADAVELERLARRAAVSSERRDRLALEVFLTRHAELDPGRAAALAQELDVGPRLLARLYRTWADAAPEAALAGLRGLDGPAVRTVAVALMQMLGDDELTAARIAAAVAGADASQLRADAIIAAAQSAPREALERAFALDDPLARSRAVREAIAMLAREDPEGALAATQRIREDDVRTRMQGMVLAQWAARDPSAALRHIARLDRQLQPAMIMSAMAPLADAAPFETLELLRGLQLSGRAPYTHLLLQRAAEQDPVRTLEYLDTLPMGMERQQLLQIVAASYGRHDPDAALAWARSVTPRQTGLVTQVLTGIAQTDPDLALELALAETSPLARTQALHQIVMQAGFAPGARQEVIAERLASLPRGIAPGLVQTLLSSWASTDPHGALEWLLANPEQGDEQGFAAAAHRLGQVDPAAAAAYVDRVPAQHRVQYIAHVAQGYGMSDPQAGLAWLERYRGDAAYPRAAAQLAQQLAQHDPASAVALLDGLDADFQERYAIEMSVASMWAMHDAPAAASWALERSRARNQPDAMRGVVQTWASVDPDAAGLWVMGLPYGSERDAVLSALVPAVAPSHPIDPQVLAAFSSGEARQYAVMSTMWALAQRDPAEARALLDAYVTDPHLRQQAEQMLENADASSVQIMESIQFSVPPRAFLRAAPPPPSRPPR